MRFRTQFLTSILLCWPTSSNAQSVLKVDVYGRIKLLLLLTGCLFFAPAELLIAQSACSYTLSPSSITASSAGGSGSFSVTASDPSCSWTVYDQSETGTVAGNFSANVNVDATSGIGSQSVTYTITPYNSHAQQFIGIGDITLGGSYDGAYFNGNIAILPIATSGQLISGQPTSSLQVTTPVLPPAVAGQIYTPFQLQATGGTPPYTWSDGDTTGCPGCINISSDGLVTSNGPVTNAFYHPILITEFLQLSDAAGNTMPVAIPYELLLTAPPPTALQFIPVTPCRVVDTRNAAGPFGGPELAAGASREFDPPQSACNIPPNAMAYSLNATVVPSGPLNYLTLWPSGTTQPNASTLNSMDGRVKANATITAAGINGGVNVFATNATQVILDIDGYFMPAGTDSALSFYPVTPCRVVDTRESTGPLGGPFIAGGSSRDFPILSSNCGLPTGAQAYSLNVTAVPHKTLNYLTAWPSGQTQPEVSTLNATTGAVTANAAIIPAASDGDISIYVSDDADVVLDVNGYFAAPATGGLSLYASLPCRVLDTRSGTGAINGVLVVGVEDSPCAPPGSAQAFVMNATVVPSGTLDYLTLWPDAENQPYVSTLNSLDGSVASNMAIVPTTNGSVDAFSTQPTQLVLDLSGYFAP